MSFFGALFTGVSGLSAQSQSTAMVANNIANVNTTGFKRSEASFYSLVTTQGRGTNYSPGTTAVNRIQRVDLQGAIQQTGSSTDAAISGNGMFAIKRDTGSTQQFLYTRSGSFSEDATGLLRNTAGFVLYGWPLGTGDSLPANQGDLASLVAVDVAFLGGLTRPTSEAELALNINASEIDSGLNAAINGAADFTRGLTVYDTLGSAQVLTMEFTKTYGPQATAAGSISDLLATDNLMTDLGLAAGDSFDVSSELGGPLSLTVVAGTPAAAGEVQTVNDIITEINNAGLGISAFLGNDGEFVIQRDEFVNGSANTLTLTNTVGTPLTGLGITLAANAGLGPDTFTSNDLVATTVTATGTVGSLTAGTTLASLGIANGDTLFLGLDGAAPALIYTAVVPGDTVQDVLNALNTVAGVTATLDSSGALVVQHNNNPPAQLDFTGSSASMFTAFGLSPSYTSNANIYDNGDPADTPPYSNSQATDINSFPTFQNLPGDNAYNSRGWWQMELIHPNGTVISRGLLNFNGDGSLNALPDNNGNVDINLSQLDWGNGSEPQNIDIDIERFSQFAGNYDVIASDQNGAELGLRTGVEITREGFVVAQFSNGATANLYKIPLITFANPSGLTEVSGTAYAENESSGEENLREAGEGGAGFLEPSTIEASNVDLADEFAKLIVAQRAFSANTKIINTVDQMTEELLRLR